MNILHGLARKFATNFLAIFNVFIADKVGVNLVIENIRLHLAVVSIDFFVIVHDY